MALPRKIVIAPNAFKGTLTALAAARAIERGLREALPRAKCLLVPVADGGDGTARAVVDATAGKMIKSVVHDPLGRPVHAAWGLGGSGGGGGTGGGGGRRGRNGGAEKDSTAIIELASASGLALLAPRERSPMKATTRGTGELIKEALDRGARHILVGIGGSATSDGGAGLARVLGARLLDARGRELGEGGGELVRLARIDMSKLDARLKDATIEVACDVDNPLTGPRGAAHVYGPQKGATPRMVKQLDAGLKRLAQVWREDLGIDVERVPGAGAAGGAGGGLMAFLGARLRPGVDIIMDAVGLAATLKGCDLVITGEGRLDAQTAFGKAPAGVARLAKAHGISAIAICGSLGPDLSADVLRGLNLAACFSALEETMDESELRRRAAGMLERCAAQVGRLLALHQKP